MSDFNLSLNPEDPLIQHAFRGSSFAVVRLEELNEISNLKADALACYRPANSEELFAVERIALCQQAIFRGYRLESGLFTVALDHALHPTCHTFRPMSADLLGDGDIEITRSQNRNYAAAEGVRQMSNESDIWALLIRYQVNADRQYRRAVEDYERVKRLRPEMPNQPGDPKLQPAQPKPDDPIASFSELGRSYLEPRPPAAPQPVPSSVVPEPAPLPAATPVFNPTAYIRRAPAEPETSRLKIVPISSFLPPHPPVARPQPTIRRQPTHHRPQTAHSSCRPAGNRPVSRSEPDAVPLPAHN